MRIGDKVNIINSYTGKKENEGVIKDIVDVPRSMTRYYVSIKLWNGDSIEVPYDYTQLELRRNVTNE